LRNVSVKKLASSRYDGRHHVGEELACEPSLDCDSGRPIIVHRRIV